MAEPTSPADSTVTATASPTDPNAGKVKVKNPKYRQFDFFDNTTWGLEKYIWVDKKPGGTDKHAGGGQATATASAAQPETPAATSATQVATSALQSSALAGTADQATTDGSTVYNPDGTVTHTAADGTVRNYANVTDFQQNKQMFVPPTPTGPKIGDSRFTNGHAETWDGTKWVPDKVGKEDKGPGEKPTESPGRGKMWQVNADGTAWEAVDDPNYDELADLDNYPTADAGFGFIWVKDENAKKWVKAVDPNAGPGGGGGGGGEGGAKGIGAYGVPDKPAESPGEGKMWTFDPLGNKWEAMDDPNYTPPRPSEEAGPGKHWEYDATAKKWDAVEDAEVGARRAAEISAGAARSQGIGAALATGQSAAAGSLEGAQTGAGKYADTYTSALGTLTGQQTQRQIQNSINTTSKAVAKMNNLTEIETTQMTNAVNTFISKLNASVALSGQANDYNIARLTVDLTREMKDKGFAAGAIQSVFQVLLSLLPPNVGETVKAFMAGSAKGRENWSGGKILVGEEGPEIVDLPPGSDVIPNPGSVGMRYIDTRVKSPITDPAMILDHVAGIARQLVPKNSVPKAPAGEKPRVSPERISRAWQYIGGM